jgi:hypothetical protein
VLGSGGQDEVVEPEALPAQAAHPQRGQVGAGDAADQQFGQRARLDLLGQRAQRPGQRGTDQFGGAHAVQDEFARLREREGLGQQHVEVVDLDAAVAQHLGEYVVLLAGLGGPQHVVEEQFVAVRGCQSAQFQAGAVHDGLAQLSDFGSDAQYPCHVFCPSGSCVAVGSSTGSAASPRRSRRALRNA